MGSSRGKGGAAWVIHAAVTPRMEDLTDDLREVVDEHPHIWRFLESWYPGLRGGNSSGQQRENRNFEPSYRPA